MSATPTRVATEVRELLCSQHVITDEACARRALRGYLEDLSRQLAARSLQEEEYQAVWQGGPEAFEQLLHVYALERLVLLEQGLKQERMTLPPDTASMDD